MQDFLLVTEYSYTGNFTFKYNTWVGLLLLLLLEALPIQTTCSITLITEKLHCKEYKKKKCRCNKLSRWNYLSGTLLGKLISQVTPDASSPTGDQYHLLAQVLPSVWQQRKQTCPDYVIEHLKREKAHTTRVLQIHLEKCSVAADEQPIMFTLQVYVHFWCPPNCAIYEQVCQHANTLICSIRNCCMSNPLASKNCVTSRSSDMTVDMHHALEMSEWSVITPVNRC